MMKTLICAWLTATIMCVTAARAEQKQPDYPIVPVPFNAVELTDTFWRPRLLVQRNVLVPFALKQTEVGVAHLRAAADHLEGKKVTIQPHRFVDSDLYKVIEGAAYLLRLNRDEKLEKQLDGIVEIIAAAQEPDGYLYPSHTTGVGSSEELMGDKPYSFVVHSHELYNMGHLYEAAVAYYQATGKDSLLKVAEKNAHHINRAFFVGDLRYNGGKPIRQAPGHEEIELALVKLYRATGKTLYLDMARQFLEIRGVTYRPNGTEIMAPEFAQQHAPVKRQREAVGHAVRAAYLYAGMADVSALTGDTEYAVALDAIWQDIVDSRMHITGGLGAIQGIEGFGPRYELPNAEAYDETCAAVGNVLFNYRMFLLTGHAKFLDVAEVALFNNVLAGVNLEGNRFFYVNPLESDGHHCFNKGEAVRAPWFDCACCPSNLARLIPQVPGMIFAHDGSDLYLTLYAGSSAQLQIRDVPVKVRQTTNYPNDGLVSISIEPARAVTFRLMLRIPTWVHDQFLPGELYQYIGGSSEPLSLRVNDQEIAPQVKDGFALVEREWRPGDHVELHLPMPVRFNKCRPEVIANQNRVAVTRGPLVLCAEGIDNEGTVKRFFFEELPRTEECKLGKFNIPEKGSFLSVRMPATGLTANGHEESTTVTFIPYYTWNNRGASSMLVWLPRKREFAAFNATDLRKNSTGADVNISRLSLEHEVIGQPIE